MLHVCDTWPVLWTPSTRLAVVVTGLVPAAGLLRVRGWGVEVASAWGMAEQRSRTAAQPLLFTQTFTPIVTSAYIG